MHSITVHHSGMKQYTYHRGEELTIRSITPKQPLFSVQNLQITKTPSAYYSYLSGAFEIYSDIVLTSKNKML